MHRDLDRDLKRHLDTVLGRDLDRDLDRHFDRNGRLGELASRPQLEDRRAEQCEGLVEKGVEKIEEPHPKVAGREGP